MTEETRTNQSNKHESIADIEPRFHRRITPVTSGLAMASFTAACFLAILSKGDPLPTTLKCATCCFAVALPALIFYVLIKDHSYSKASAYGGFGGIFGFLPALAGIALSISSISYIAAGLFVFSILIWFSMQQIYLDEYVASKRKTEHTPKEADTE